MGLPSLLPRFTHPAPVYLFTYIMCVVSWARLTRRPPTHQGAAADWPLTSPGVQAKDALSHPYFDDLDKATVDLLESPEVRAREAEEAAMNTA
jgi:hypothetical protein